MIRATAAQPVGTTSSPQNVQVRNPSYSASLTIGTIGNRRLCRKQQLSADSATRCFLHRECDVYSVTDGSSKRRRERCQ